MLLLKTHLEIFRICHSKHLDAYCLIKIKLTNQAFFCTNNCFSNKYWYRLDCIFRKMQVFLSTISNNFPK